MVFGKMHAADVLYQWGCGVRASVWYTGLMNMKERLLIAFIVISLVFVFLNGFGDPRFDNMKIWSVMLLFGIATELVIKIRRKRRRDSGRVNNCARDANEN